jgi:predicted anti-sigma-YlaC factor YlaD
MSGCNEIIELMSASLDGELTDAERRTLEAHLAACGTCREELAHMERTWEALLALGEARPAPDLTSRVVRHARWRRAVGRRAAGRRWATWAAVAAVLLVALFVGYLLQERGFFGPGNGGSGVAKKDTIDASDETVEIVQNIEILENLEVLESLDTIVDMGERVLLLPVENGSESANGGES